MKKPKMYWLVIPILLIVAMSSCTAVHLKQRGEIGDHSFCVVPGPVPESECKNIKTFRALNGYIAYPGAGYSKYADFLKIGFLYPSMKMQPFSFVDVIPFRKPQLPAGEIPMNVTVSWLGQPFENSQFGLILSIRMAGERRIDSSENIYGLRLYSELKDIENTFPFQKLIPANGEKTVLVDCGLPWRGTNGSYFTDVSCRIRSKLGSEYYLDYSIKKTDLPRWQDINRKTQQLIESFIVR